MRLESPIRDRKRRILLVISRMLSHRPAQLVFLGLALCLFLLTYLHIVQIQDSAKNPEIGGGDQVAYLNFAKEANHSNFHYTGGRARMPLYPWIQGVLYSPELTDDEFFEQAKHVNVALSIVMLAALGVAFYAKFSRFYATWSILCLALLVYAIKSPYVLVENLYYGLFAFAYFLSLEALFAPKWYKTIGCGVLIRPCPLCQSQCVTCAPAFRCSYAVVLITLLGPSRAHPAARTRSDPARTVASPGISRPLVALFARKQGKVRQFLLQREYHILHVVRPLGRSLGGDKSFR